MHDLRRQALESGKTISRKARSRQASGQSSRAGSAASSRAASRVASRNASDDEEGSLSDSTNFSLNSIDDVLASEDVDTDAPPELWKAELSDRIEQLVDRKRSSVQGREESLAAYTHLLTSHYAKDDISARIGELLPAILKSIKADTSERETVLALKALAVTIITDPSDTIYDAATGPLKRTIADSGSMATKAAAIHTLGTAAFYGGASLDETENIMAFLLEIIESDGVSVSADDSAEVVTAALEEWGFLATQLEDMSESTEEAMDALVEQLESSSSEVAIAAGENIALLYEKSYTELEEGEDAPSDGSEESDDEDPGHTSNGPKMVNRYTVYRRADQLKHTLETLASISGRGISKKDRKTLHSSFADILHTVEHPARGPAYSTAVSRETGKRYGSRMIVRIRDQGEMRIDKWWKLSRLKALRRVLQGGFVRHYEENEVVFESLPIMISRK
ncbi:hypothetical protein H2201_005263 [Coniosporium apollinis]|uniref:Interferon-related developmental regulator N-terminal domain-containing protein n=1 Tax=Coniosporium apollinis TaxID=61459 RepID=A0ABQ9NQE2_9PEZI|nr:hypothetical protein H2201_005263 [Coniosporium apollinis]